MFDSYEKRFYGIYEGICSDNADPTFINRIKLQIPQLLGTEITDWAMPCLPVTDNANHPDHKAHLAADVAALLTTTPVVIAGSGTSATGGAVTVTSTVPALTVVAANANTLTHPHVTTVDKTKKWNGSGGSAFNDATDTKEHTAHRLVPNVGQKVWVMFIAGDPNHPVWMGVHV